MEETAEEDHYTLSEILQLVSATSHFPATHQPPPPPSLLLHHDLVGHHRNLALISEHQDPQPPVPPQQYYDGKATSTMTNMMMMMMGGRDRSCDLHQYNQDHQLPHHGQEVTATAAAAAAGSNTSISVLCGSEMMEMEMSNCMGGGNMRWPRQETLALLEIRSQLDSKFKDANQKAPLWDDVSRIMAEEHGYHRSGKKCKEKFENLYKYYKKTKAGKVGKPDGKHYRFFRQLEALYGETSSSSNPVSASKTQFLENPTNQNNTAALANQQGLIIQNDKKLNELLSFSIPSELETSSSESHQNGLTTNALMETNVIAAKKKKKKESDGDGCRREKQKWKLKASEFITTEMGKIIEIQEAWFEKMFKTLENKEQEMQFRREKWRKQEAARHNEECKFWGNEHAWIKTRYVLLTEILQKLIETSSSDPNENRREKEVETECKKKKHKENSKTCPHVQNFDSISNRQGHKTMGLHSNFDGFCSSHANGNNPAAHDATFGFR